MRSDWAVDHRLLCGVTRRPFATARADATEMAHSVVGIISRAMFVETTGALRSMQVGERKPTVPSPDPPLLADFNILVRARCKFRATKDLKLAKVYPRLERQITKDWPMLASVTDESGAA